ncbi:MAG TPA: flippase activity-associated protein Agl23 [Roseiflexaceae bacterium]|nr:flippase activity-associated protein Agl23 [Roseiflexaceae bacterium]
MSVAELPPRAAPRLDEAPPVAGGQRWLALTVEHLAYLAIVALALITRLWELDNRALHHDETLHAAFSWAVFRGEGYVHDPLLHGPFLYFFGALVFFLFGDSDATARLGPALFGVALVALPYLLRRELGRGAALLASALLLISPAFTYMGRFLRHDPYGVVFELVALIGVVRYASTRRPVWLYAAATALGLMAANMETFYLYLAIFAPAVAAALLWRVWRGGLLLAAALGLAVAALIFVLPGQPQRPSPGSDTVVRASGPYLCPSPAMPFPPANPILTDRPGPIFGWPPLETTDNQYALCARHQPDNDLGLYLIKLGQFAAHPAILLAVVLAPAGAAALAWQIWRRRGPGGRTAWERARATGDSTLAAFASLASGRRWLVALGACFVPYALLFSAFLTNPVGVISGATGSLLYWLAQHEVQRGGQPAHYYAVLLALYEPLILLWGLVGLAMVATALVRRLRSGDRADSAHSTQHSDALPPLLAWWAVASFALYSWAGEKMPWLTIHMALPLALLGAWALARTLAWWRSSLATATTEDAAGVAVEPGFPSARAGLGMRVSSLAIYLGLFATVVALCFLLVAVNADMDAPGVLLLPWVLPFGLALLAVLTLGAGLLCGARWAMGALAIGLSLTLALYSMRSAFQLSFRWGDVPREMLIYTQTSPDVQRVVDRLEEAATRRGGALDLHIWYDNETVWDWYMRRFTNAREQPPVLEASPGEEVQAVLMLQENYALPENQQRLEGFRIQRYPLRWWFPEDQGYRLEPGWLTGPVDEHSSLLARMLRTPFDTRTAVQFWQYIIYRVPPAPLGSTDFVLAVRPALADEIGLGTGGDQ